MKVSRNTIIISLMLLSVSVTAYGQGAVKRQDTVSENGGEIPNRKVDSEYYDGLAQILDNGKCGYIN